MTEQKGRRVAHDGREKRMVVGDGREERLVVGARQGGKTAGG